MKIAANKPTVWGIICLSLVGLGAVTRTLAQDTAWTNTVSGNWTDAGNWNPSVPPGPGTNAFLTNNTGATVYTVTNDVLNNTFGGLTIFNPSTGLHTLFSAQTGLNPTGDVIVGRLGRLLIDGSTAEIGGSITVSNLGSVVVTNSGAVLSVLDGALNGGSVFVSASGVLNLGGNSQSAANASSLTFTNSAGGTITLANNGSLGTLNASTNGIGLYNQGTLTMPFGAGATPNTGFVNAVVFNAVGGVVQANGGNSASILVLDAFPTNLGTITYGPFNQLHVTRGDLYNDGSILMNHASSSLLVIGGGSGALFNDTNGVILNRAHTFTIGSTLNRGTMIMSNTTSSGLYRMGGPITNEGEIVLYRTVQSASRFNAFLASNILNSGTIRAVGLFDGLTNTSAMLLSPTPITNQPAGTLIVTNGGALAMNGVVRNLGMIRVESNSTFGAGGIGSSAAPHGYKLGTLSYQNEGTIDLRGGAFATTLLTNDVGAVLQGYGDVGVVTYTNLANFARFIETRNIVNAGTIALDGALNAGAISNLAGGRIIGFGTIQALDGTNLDTGASSYVNTGAQVYNAPGASLLASGGTLVLSNGLLNNLNLGTLGASNGVLQLGDGTLALTNNDTVVLRNGSYFGGSLLNNSNLNFGAPAVPTEIVELRLMSAPLTIGTLYNASGASLNISNAMANVTAVVTNPGTVRVVNSHITFSNTVVLSGRYVSDPSTNTFVDDLTVTPSGTLEGGAGDLFDLKKSLLSSSTNNLQFNLTASEVRFSGGGIHTNAVTGGDFGSNVFAFADNFGYGRLTLDSAGDQLQFLSGGFTNGAAPANALYVRELALWNGLTLDSNLVANLFSPFNIYYLRAEDSPFNAYLDDQTFSLTGGGFLIPVVPEPSANLLMVALGTGFLFRLRRK